MGFISESRVASVLIGYGHRIQRMSYKGGFDLLMDGTTRIEVKVAKPQRLVWKFNIHRHNVMSESRTDFYVLRFEGVPGSSNAIHALYLSPLNKPTIAFSFRQLLEGAIAPQVASFRALSRRKTN